MLACGSASQNGWSETPERKWGGFHGTPLITSSRVPLNIPMGGEGGIVSGGKRAPTVCVAVHAHVVPDDAMTHAILLGRDGWADFPIRKYVDMNENETVLTFTAREQGNAKNAQRYSDLVNNAVGIVEPSSSTAVVACFAGNRSRIPSAVMG